MTSIPGTLSDAENALIARTGVYGVWLVKHAKNLPHEPYANAIRRAYAGYLVDKYSWKQLFDAIDSFCVVHSWERVGEKYEMALKDLLKTRKPEEMACHDLLTQRSI